MSLRPRYSLLTLLLLTALVAGGVKLWYGPHHEFKSSLPYVEVEYTYTRDWRGNRIIRGVRVNRYEQPSGMPEHVMLEYYRAGLHLNVRRIIILDAAAKTYRNAYDTQEGQEYVLTPQEQTEFDQAVEEEYQRWQKRGYSLKPYEVTH